MVIPKVEVFYRILTLQGKQRNVLLTHNFIQIHPGRIHTLTPDIIPGIEHAIQDLDSQVGHTDLVDIREAHTETDINAVPVLHYGIDFVADVAGRFFDLHQNIII